MIRYFILIIFISFILIFGMNGVKNQPFSLFSYQTESLRIIRAGSPPDEPNLPPNQEQIGPVTVVWQTERIDPDLKARIREILSNPTECLRYALERIPNHKLYIFEKEQPALSYGGPFPIFVTMKSQVIFDKLTQTAYGLPLGINENCGILIFDPSFLQLSNQEQMLEITENIWRISTLSLNPESKENIFYKLNTAVKNIMSSPELDEVQKKIVNAGILPAAQWSIIIKKMIQAGFDEEALKIAKAQWQKIKIGLQRVPSDRRNYPLINIAYYNEIIPFKTVGSSKADDLEDEIRGFLITRYGYDMVTGMFDSLDLKLIEMTKEDRLPSPELIENVFFLMTPFDRFISSLTNIKVLSELSRKGVGEVFKGLIPELNQLLDNPPEIAFGQLSPGELTELLGKLGIEEPISYEEYRSIYEEVSEGNEEQTVGTENFLIKSIINQQYSYVFNMIFKEGLRDTSEIFSPGFIEQNWDRLKEGMCFRIDPALVGSNVILELRRANAEDLSTSTGYLFINVLRFSGSSGDTRLADIIRFAHSVQQALEPAVKAKGASIKTCSYKEGILESMNPDAFKISSLSNKEFYYVAKEILQRYEGSPSTSLDEVFETGANFVTEDFKEAVSDLETKIKEDAGREAAGIVNGGRLLLEQFIKHAISNLFDAKSKVEFIIENHIAASPPSGFSSWEEVVRDLEEKIAVYNRCFSYLDGPLGNLFYRIFYIKFFFPVRT